MMAPVSRSNKDPAAAIGDPIVVCGRIHIIHHADRVTSDIPEYVVMNPEIAEITVGNCRVGTDAPLDPFKGAAADLHILADRLIIDRIVSVEMPVCHSGQNLELYRLRIVIAAKISMITREPAFSDPYLAAGSEFQVMAIPDIFEGHFVKGQIRRMSDLHDAAPIPAPVPGSSDKMNP